MCLKILRELNIPSKRDFFLHDQDNFEHKLEYYPHEMIQHYRNDLVTKNNFQIKMKINFNFILLKVFEKVLLISLVMQLHLVMLFVEKNLRKNKHTSFF